MKKQFANYGNETAREPNPHFCENVGFFVVSHVFVLSMSSIQVRPATLRDAKAIAQVHTSSALEA